ncbi:hypothetical protein [Paracoccus simplex]|uniref:Uncharacterized protein n=1 Tax=Paracoccus simplex TaxID=2086346 RepID=A0ABV7RVW1_9RHOB
MSHQTTPAEGRALGKKACGYHQDLKPRQVQVIAIGTGLFPGAGGRLASAGPALARHHHRPPASPPRPFCWAWWC